MADGGTTVALRREVAVRPAVASAPVAASRPLVHRHVDGWLLGGLGIVAWAGVRWGPAWLVPSVVVGALTTATATHFGASYHLAYGDGVASVRRRPFFLGVLPLALLAACLAVPVVHGAGADGAAEGLLRVLLITVFTLTGWHYVKQAFGVGILVGRGAGMRPSAIEAKVLRFGLYPVWLFDVLEIYGRGRPATFGAYDVSVGIVPAAWTPWGRAIAIASLLITFATMARVAMRDRARVPMGLWGAYLTAGLWFIWPPNAVAASVVLAGLHSIQYLACVHRAELDLAIERGERHLVHRWACVMGGAAAGGLLLTRYLTSVGDARVVVAGLPGLAGALLFAYFNLHHYAVDAAIWRSGGDHVRRISRGPAVADEAAVAAPVPALVPA